MSEDEIRQLADAARVLAEFAKTAPGRLPQRVQDAIAAVDGTPEGDRPKGEPRPVGFRHIGYARYVPDPECGGRLVCCEPDARGAFRVFRNTADTLGVPILPDAQRLVDECAPFLKDGETPAECIERNRKDAAAVFSYYDDAQRWRWVRDHWDDMGGISFPREGFRPSWTAPSDPAKLTAYVDERRAAAGVKGDDDA